MLRPGLLFFAYGCLMHPESLAGVLGHRISGGAPACADGWRLAFNLRDADDGYGRVANLVPAKGCRVCGVVHRVAHEELPALDDFEGVPETYRRASLWVQPLGRPARQAALAYLGQPGRVLAEGTPSPEYAALLIEGARLHGLPTPYVDWLVAKADGQPVDCYPANGG